MDNLFVTFNKNSEIGENTALRLQTLSNLYGFSVLLPYRNSHNISSETKSRINNSKFVLSFCIDNFSEALQQDLEYAVAKNKPIVVIYDHNQPKKIDFNGKSNVKEVFIDYSNIDENLHDISGFVKEQFEEIKSNEKEKLISGIGVVVLIGLGLLAAWAFSEKE